jgi:hypothetical protein
LLCASLALLAAGCGAQREDERRPPPTEAELKEMAEHVQTNASTRSEFRGIYLDHEFWADEGRTRPTTVRAELIALGASLRDGKVVDAKGRELFFYQPPSTSHPRHDPEPRAVKGAVKLSDLYHVVVMYGPMPKD